MTLRDYIQKLENNGELTRVKEPISTHFEMAAILKELEPRTGYCSKT